MEKILFLELAKSLVDLLLEGVLFELNVGALIRIDLVVGRGNCAKVFIAIFGYVSGTGFRFTCVPIHPAICDFHVGCSLTHIHHLWIPAPMKLQIPGLLSNDTT